MNLKNHSQAEKVLLWRESLTKLSDQQFFDLLRMYIGEIKTPYNKQNLIEQMSSVLRKEENKQKILSLLDYQDRLILAALHVFSGASFTQLKHFFSDSISSYDLETDLQNLEERLLLFRSLEPSTEKKIYLINPLLEEALLPFIGSSVLFPKSKLHADIDSENTFFLNSHLLAAVYAFVFQFPDLCKIDGSLKKKHAQTISELFLNHCDISCFEKLISALQNMGLFKQVENETHIDHERWNEFSLLSEQEQYAYIAAASIASLPRSVLANLASICTVFLMSLEENLYTRKILKRIAFVFFEKLHATTMPKVSKLRTLLQQNQAKKTELAFDSALLVDSLISFGLLEVLGIDDEDEALYKVRKTETSSDTKKLVHLGSSFFVSILPGLSLHSLLPLVKIMDLQGCDTSLSFEITKQSVTRAFESGMKPDFILKTFEAYSVHEIPQNFHHAIQDWYANFKSGSLYKGFVLHVDADKIIAVENNAVLKKYLCHTLAPGVYLMNFASEDEAHDAVQKSGLDFIGRIKTLAKPSISLPLSPLQHALIQSPIDFADTKTDEEKNHILLSKKRDVQKELLDYLAEMDLTKEQREDLSLRIKKKIVFSTEQIRPDSVRYVKTEAKGMDFLGKIAIVEQAISSELRLEIRYDGLEKEEKKVFVGKPLLIEKFTNDALVHLEVEEKKEPVQLSVGGASLVKLIRKSFVF